MSDPTSHTNAGDQAALQARAQYTQDEWFKIMNGPGRAGVMVIAAGPSGITGVLAEMQEVALSLQEGTRGLDAPPLLRAMRDALTNTSPEEVKALRDAQPHERARNTEDLKAQARDGLRQAAWLVSAKSSPEDAAAYKQLIVTTAERVAAAAKEGGFLGIGGVQVSEGEKAAIEDIRHLLGLSGSADAGVPGA
ncbi:hypothetical protein [Deinococcus maricopensis]|uniref:Uncharacterized protein n=1 Tax=Deinococcus maricopensis (strain DSM 21211 / LMG 22137 / NRRL B-23946 / LB-34) TaxID=709986 RepID=E8U925_DEIML|nr:hypothetical protein [Deinococcus maricopensis]ADV67564.1 hypothetical protein Deima_1919 [Deinococcus maricopensis DSM 21211]